MTYRGRYTIQEKGRRFTSISSQRQQDTNANSGANNNRRVYPSDTLYLSLHVPSYHHIYRPSPSTTKFEKALCYPYTRQQYEIMALELYYEQN